MTEYFTITAANGTTFNVVYGIRTPRDKRPTVAFYDAKDPVKFPPIGQFVSSYYPETVREVATKGQGLNLHGGVDPWSIDGESLGKVDDWVLHQEHNEFVEDDLDAEMLDGVQVRIDGDLIGWMADWGAPWERDWLDKGWVTTVEHNSGGLGGFSLRVTDAGREQITKGLEGGS